MFFLCLHRIKDFVKVAFAHQLEEHSNGVPAEAVSHHVHWVVAVPLRKQPLLRLFLLLFFLPQAAFALAMATAFELPKNLKQNKCKSVD
jgi:hypothetical protein